MYVPWLTAEFIKQRCVLTASSRQCRENWFLLLSGQRDKSYSCYGIGETEIVEERAGEESSKIITSGFTATMGKVELWLFCWGATYKTSLNTLLTGSTYLLSQVQTFSGCINDKKKNVSS